jgi:hypothetical protein
MVVPTCEERTTSRESVREIFGRKHVHVLVYHVTDGAEAQEPVVLQKIKEMFDGYEASYSVA